MMLGPMTAIRPKEHPWRVRPTSIMVQSPAARQMAVPTALTAAVTMTAILTPTFCMIHVAGYATMMPTMANTDIIMPKSEGPAPNAPPIWGRIGGTIMYWNTHPMAKTNRTEKLSHFLPMLSWSSATPHCAIAEVP